MDEKCTCTICNEKFDYADMTEFDGEMLCPDCLADETTHCNRCGERIWNSENEGNDEVPLCGHCYDYYYTSCEDCGRLLALDDACYMDESDIPYCQSCFQSRENDIHIHDYSYKPNPIFYGSGTRFFGAELEIDGSGKDSENAEAIERCANVAAELIYIKSDGSIDEGFEIVTHPMTLDFHRKQMPWRSILEKALELGYMSHKTTTCGLHLHVRDSFPTEKVG